MDKFFTFNSLKFNLFIIFLFVISFAIQNSFVEIFFNYFNSNNFSGSLIYLPHGIRVIAVLAFGWNIFPALFIGSYLTGLFLINNNFDFSLSNITASEVVIIGSLISASCVFVSTYFVQALNPLAKLDVRSIEIKTILIVVIASSVVNSLLHGVLYGFAYSDWQSLAQFFQYLIGDTLGALLIFFLVKLGFRINSNL